jgi:hypothetical protein
MEKERERKKWKRKERGKNVEGKREKKNGKGKREGKEVLNTKRLCLTGLKNIYQNKVSSESLKSLFFSVSTISNVRSQCYKNLFFFVID